MLHLMCAQRPYPTGEVRGLRPFSDNLASQIINPYKEKSTRDYSDVLDISEWTG